MLVDSVLSSEVLPASNEISDRLMEIGRELRLISYRPTKAMIYLLRTRLTDLLDDLSDEIDGFERTMRMIELVVAIAKARVLMLGEGKQSFRHTARVLLQQNPARTIYLDTAFQDALRGKHAALLDLGQQTLEAIGGALHAEDKVLLPERVRLPLWT